MKINALIHAAAAMLAATSTARAADRLVPEQYPTIEAAVQASVANDVVSIAPGVYRIGSITLPPHEILVTGRGSREQTVLTGAGLVIGVGSGTRTIARLTMRNCTSYGAIEVHAGRAAVIDVLFENCNQGIFATSPAGGSVPAAFIQTTDCSFRSNVRGGYAYINSSWTALRCDFIGNSNPGAVGGAASVERVIGTSIANFTDCVFVGNSAVRGGAIGMRFGGEAVFNRCYFEGNSAKDVGDVSFYEAGGSISMSNGTLCGHSVADLSGEWWDGGGNGFFPDGCPDCNDDGLADAGQLLLGQLEDADADGIPDVCQPPTCIDADFFRDFNVNGADLGILLSQWGPSTSLTVADLNRDGFVDGADLGMFLGFWGACP